MRTTRICPHFLISSKLTAGRVKNAPMIRLDDLGEKADDGSRRIELASALPLCHRKLAEEVFVDSSKGVVVECRGNLRYFFEQFLEKSARKKVVGQHAGKRRVILFDVAPRLIYRFSYVCGFGKVEEVVETRLGVEEEHTVIRAGVF